MRKSQDKPTVPDADLMEVSKARKTWCERHSCDFSRCPADEHSAGELEAMDEAESAARSAESTKPANAAPAPGNTQPEGNTAGVMEIDYTGDPGPYKSEISPRLIGDIDAIQSELKAAGMFWYEGDSFNHVKHTDVPRVLEVLKKHNYSVKITKVSTGNAPKATPAGTGGSRATASQRAPGAAPSPKSKPAPATKEPTLLHGTIERVNFITTNDSKVMAYVTIKGKKRKYDLSSWSKTINEFLEKGKGKTADVYVLIKGKYRNLVGLKRIGSQEFIEGKVPVIQQEEREAGLPFKE
jgi:hypothetical protein